MPADGVVHGQSKCEIHVRKCFAYWGGDRKNVTDTKKVLKKDLNNFKKYGYPYILCYEFTEVAILFNMSLVSGWDYLFLCVQQQQQMYQA